MKKFWMFLFACNCFFAVTTQAQIKTITNADLEKYRQQRLKNDPDDERERQRLGLPTRREEEQARQKRAAETNEFAEKVRQNQAELQDAFQAQAFEISSQIAAVEAEINYIAARIGDIPATQTFYSIGYNPYFYSPRCCVSYNSRATQIGGRITVGRRPQISLGFNYGRSVYGQKREVGIYPRARGNFAANRYYGIVAAPLAFSIGQYSTREELLANLRELEQTRAGLYARYRALEDAAHRAGVELD